MMAGLLMALPMWSQGLSATPNKPLGEGKGMYPGRVVWIHEPDVAKWDGQTGRWWDDGNIDQTVLENMFDKSIAALIGTKNLKKGWDKIFRYHNKSVGRGNRGYRIGETIAIKINLNNTTTTDDRDNDIDQSPQSTIAMIRQLTEKAGVPEECIIIYDASIGWHPRAIPDRLYVPVHKLFPGVRWMSAEGSKGVEPAEWVENAIAYTDPKVSLGNGCPVQWWRPIIL